VFDGDRAGVRRTFSDVLPNEGVQSTRGLEMVFCAAKLAGTTECYYAWTGAQLNPNALGASREFNS
jgi:hypothetical protein